MKKCLIVVLTVAAAVATVADIVEMVVNPTVGGVINAAATAAVAVGHKARGK